MATHGTTEGAIESASSRVSYSEEEAAEEDTEKGKSDLSKTTWRETRTRWVERSRQRYPLWSGEYPRKTTGGMGRKLMRGSGREIRVAGTPKDTKVIVGGRGAKKSKVGGGVRNRLGGEAVEQIGNNSQPLGQVAGGKGGLEKQGTHDVVRNADHAFCPAVLRRGIGARHPQLSVVGEEGAGCGVVKLPPVVTLDSPDGASKLNGNPSEEVRKGGERIRLQTQGKSP
jgi:hypothetical protein